VLQSECRVCIPIRRSNDVRGRLSSLAINRNRRTFTVGPVVTIDTGLFIVFWRRQNARFVIELEHSKALIISLTGLFSFSATFASPEAPFKIAPSFRPYACNNSRTAERISTKFDIGGFC
jgi:hypothetical protein